MREEDKYRGIGEKEVIKKGMGSGAKQRNQAVRGKIKPGQMRESRLRRKD